MMCIFLRFIIKGANDAVLFITFEKGGKPLGAMDMLIAANAASTGAILVTHDKAFFNVRKHLSLEDWTQ